jgi:hypothetical protein
MKCLIGLVDIHDKQVRADIRILSQWHGIIEEVFSGDATSYYLVVNVDKLVECQTIAHTRLWYTLKRLVSEKFHKYDDDKTDKYFHDVDFDMCMLSGFLVKGLA